jgi:hypothetical protein
MLDKLNEDLNRVTDKPYFEGVETDGKTITEIAEEVWRGRKEGGRSEEGGRKEGGRRGGRSE